VDCLRVVGFAGEVRHDASLVSAVAVLKQVDALPGA
jgi:hypothetical protein